jgi:hypothetical protein
MADFFNRVIDRFVKRNNWSKPAQVAHYKREYNVFDRQQDKYGKSTIPSASEMDDVSTVSAADFQQHTGQINSFIYKKESSKIQRMSTWREMSQYPILSFALGEIEDEAINFDANGEFIQLNIKSERLAQNENIMINLNKEWKYIMSDVLEAHKYINEWWMDFMVEGEIFFEKVVDPENAKQRGILRVKRLRPEFTHPIWAEIESDNIYQFIYKGPSNILIMPTQMVAYANSGIYCYPDRENKEVLSFLEKSKIDYRKLKQMEDSLIIYRLVRGPERRIFKIEVGKLPKQKAEMYVKNLMQKYRQRKTYDPSTGEASQNIDTLAMIEDYWFPSQDGKGSSIETLPGGENLGQIDDVIYFQKQLYRSIRIPMSRLEQDTGFSLGDTSDITREEVRFNKMVSKFTNRFANVFLQIYLSHLRLKGYADEYGLTEKDFQVKLNTNNLFQDYIETELLTQRAENFERFIPYAEASDGGEPLFDKQWLMKRFLKFSPEDILENEQYLRKNKNKNTSGGESGGDGGLDLGGSSGGGSGGGLDLGGDAGSSTEEGGFDIGGGGEPDKSKDNKDKGIEHGGEELDSFA